jgi:hypothetical protein
VNRATLLERKRFARELAALDAAAGVEWVPPAADQRAESVLEDGLVRARMRRWWLERYTLEEIRELAAGFADLELGG